MTRPVVAVLAPYYLPGAGGGGPIRTVQAMVTEHRGTADFRILTSDQDWGVGPLDVATERWTEVEGTPVWYAPGGARGLLAALREVRRLRPDVIYANSLFDPHWSIPFVLAWRLRLLRARRFVLAPRGELGAGALALKAGKKRAMLSLARTLRLYAGVAFHASTPAEADEVRAQLPGARVVVRENESLLPRRADEHAEAPAEGPVRLVFLGRVSRKKGVHTVLAALASVTVPVTLDVYGGADDDAYLAQCRALAARLPASVTVRFHGPVTHDQVADVFASHDAFVFPTQHENFGHTIAEALAAGCPVVLPPTTPWSELVRDGGGVLADSTDPAAWGSLLDEIARWSVAQRQARRRGAAHAFDTWRSRSQGPSVFEKLEAGE